MTDREKLIELLGDDVCKQDSCDDCDCQGSTDMCIATLKVAMADHLIANGVTVQKWIPASEPPEQPHKWVAREWYLVALKNGVVVELCYEFLESSVFGYGWRKTADPVTHWMPKPEPPKEDDNA